MTQGYFLRRPSVTRSATFTPVYDRHHAVILRAELSSLLEKKAIREVESRNHQAWFFPKEDGGLRPVLLGFSPSRMGVFVLSWTFSP